MRNAFSYFVKINIPISSLDDQLFFQVSSPPERSRETEKPRLAAHASPRNDEKASKHSLERFVSFRTANIGALTSQHNIGLMLASIHTLLPPMGVFRNGEFLVTVERD